jgi:CheY-like chemotaxis protein
MRTKRSVWGRKPPMRHAFQLILVGLVLWGRQLCCADEPLSLAEAMQERSALGSAMTNRFAQPGWEGSTEGNHTNMMVLGTAVVFAIVVFRFLAPRFGGFLNRRLTPWRVAPTIGCGAAKTDQLMSELVASFALRTGATRDRAASEAGGSPSQAPPAAEAAKAVSGSNPVAEFQQLGASQHETVNEVARFLKFAPAELADLQRLLLEASRSGDPSARQRMFLQLCERLRYLCYNSRQLELLPAWQMAVCLEGLLRKLACSASIVTDSALRTVAGGLDVLHDFCAGGETSRFASDTAARLLVVDDDAVSRLAISAALKESFNQPALAPDGETGLSLATTNAYDAIFLDVEMPGIDGFELCTKIHETKLNPITPVVFVTQHNDFQARAKAAETGGHDLIGKPFVPLEIRVKALTLVFRSRLEHRQQNLETTKKNSGTDPEPKPLGSAHVPSLVGSERRPGKMMQPLCSGVSRGYEKPATASGSTSSTALTHPEVLVSFPCSSRSSAADRPPSSSGACVIAEEAKPTPYDYANALYKFAPAHLEQLAEQLQSASKTDDSAVRQELLAELYVGVHSLTSEAQRAELGVFRQLGSALEALLRKLLERSEYCTPSTLEIGAAALSLLDELCHSRLEPVLDKPPVRILLVDDDPIALRTLAGAIQRVFERPKTADSGESALTLVGEGPFDLILLDVLMPGMDGFATCTKIKQTKHNERTPVVFVTRQSDTDSRRQGANVGGGGFIPKPFFAAEITVAVLTFAVRGRLANLRPSTRLEEVVTA